MAAREAEAKELSPQAARYAQILVDKAASHRLRTLPADLQSLHRGAVDAAAELGEDAPDSPNWVDELCKNA